MTRAPIAPYPALRLVEKTVHLVNAADAIPTMAFLI